MNINWLESLFPNRCNQCSAPLLKGQVTHCNICIDHIPLWPNNHGPEEFALEIFCGRVPIASLHVLSPFHKGSPIQSMLHAIKYQNDPKLAFELGRKLGHRLSNTLPKSTLINAVPLHPEKLKIRGYNQSGWITLGISSATGFQETNLLSRITFTSTQTKLNRVDRWANMEEVFKVTAEETIRGKTFLLVDDTLTTGATLEHCALLLLKNGAKSVHVAVLAYAP